MKYVSYSLINVLILLLTGSGNLAHADIYVMNNADGELIYSNNPSSNDYQPVIFDNHVDVPDNTLYINKVNSKKQQAVQTYLNIASKTNKFDLALLMALVATESNFNPYAKSDKGAVGLMQLMPEVAKIYHVKNVYDPLQNLNGGIAYFKKLLSQHKGNVPLSIAAYNAGHESVRKHGERIPPYQETMIYVAKVMAHYELYRDSIKGL